MKRIFNYINENKEELILLFIMLVMFLFGYISAIINFLY